LTGEEAPSGPEDLVAVLQESVRRIKAAR